MSNTIKHLSTSFSLVVMDEYIVLDIETTGLSRYMHKITEIAAVKVKTGKVVDEFQTLIDPEVHIPSFITRLTGITDNMVKDAPKIHEALPDFLEFASGLPIVAHNASFDHGFILYNAKTYLNYEFCNEKVCTRKLANRLLPDLHSKRLGVICEHLDIRNENAHRAMADVKATTQVFQHFIGLMSEMNIKTKEEIINFETRPKRN
jgi:DNA polymerase-3 subunit alpha (Gram-positive type)